MYKFWESNHFFENQDSSTANQSIIWLAQSANKFLATILFPGAPVCTVRKVGSGKVSKNVLQRQQQLELF